MARARKQFAVIGLGRFGSSVARALAERGHEVLGIDRDPGRTQAVTGFLTHVLAGDATDEDVLKSLGVRNFDAVVVSMGEDVQSSVLVTLLLKEQGVRRVIAKASDDLHAKVLQRVGADRVVLPEKEMGIRLAHSLVSSNVLDYIGLGPDLLIEELYAASGMVGRSLRQLDLRGRYGINVVAIRRGPAVIASPQADEVLQEDDVLVVIGSESGVRRLEERD